MSILGGAFKKLYLLNKSLDDWDFGTNKPNKIRENFGIKFGKNVMRSIGRRCS